MKDAIYRRKSTRSYETDCLDANTIKQIEDFLKSAKPLFSGIKSEYKLLAPDQIRCLLPWRAPHNLAILMEDKPGACENAGFIGQQLDLFLQSRGIAACWLGMGRLSAKELAIQKSSGLELMCIISFGMPKGEELRNSIDEFKRKPLLEISDVEDKRLEPARLAPSSTNSQPWYFIHEGDMIHAFCVERTGIKKLTYGKMNRIDMGIALAHMYVTYPETFAFEVRQNAPKKDGFYYTGTFSV